MKKVCRLNWVVMDTCLICFTNLALLKAYLSFSVFILCIYLGFYVAFNTVQVISRRVVGRAEETSTYSSSGFCTVNCRPTASNYQLSHLRPCWESNPGLRGGRRECYHSATVAPSFSVIWEQFQCRLLKFQFNITYSYIHWLLH